jgi:hypothetical protein
VAALVGMDPEGLITGAVGAGGSPQACETMSQVLGSSVDVPTSFSRHGGTSVAVRTAASTEEGVIWVVVDCCCGPSFVCVAILQVLVLVWVPESAWMVVFVACLVFAASIALSNPSFATR